MRPYECRHAGGGEVDRTDLQACRSVASLGFAPLADTFHPESVDAMVEWGWAQRPSGPLIDTAHPIPRSECGYPHSLNDGLSVIGSSEGAILTKLQSIVVFFIDNYTRASPACLPRKSVDGKLEGRTGEATLFIFHNNS